MTEPADAAVGQVLLHAVDCAEFGPGHAAALGQRVEFGAGERRLGERGAS